MEGEPDAPPPVVVRIRQTGSETLYKGNWSHAWKESGRTVDVRPFTLVRADGTRVQVEPDVRVVLHEKLARIEHQARAARERIAEVVPGTEVHVIGELSGTGSDSRASAYRGSSTLPALRRPRTGPMVISNEALGDTDRRRMRFYMISAATLVALFTVVFAIAMPYPVLAIDGTTVLARPTEVGRWQIWSKPKNGPGHWIPHEGIRATGTLPDGSSVKLEDECGAGIADRASSDGCTAVPFVVSTHWPEIHQVGARPTLGIGQMFFLLAITLIVSVVYPIAALLTRPWYLRLRVNDSGAGRLSTAAGEDWRRSPSA